MAKYLLPRKICQLGDVDSYNFIPKCTMYKIRKSERSKHRIRLPKGSRKIIN